MITIGLCGGIASGKSEVGRLLAARGAHVVDADREAHLAYAPGTAGFDMLVDAFGRGIVGEDGVIDRRKLGDVVFGDADRLRQLTDIVWPLTRQRVESIKREQAASGCQAFVVEAPLLIEAGWRDMVDEVWVVRAPVDVARERLMTRRGLSAADADARIASRNLDRALAAADVIIDNEGGFEELEAKVEAAWRAVLARAGSRISNG